MPRKRPPRRLDSIADAATEIFIRQGFSRTGVANIASAAKVAPGTIYLYAESKDALYDLALRRAFEDPTVWTLALPHPAPAPGAVASDLWRCLQNAAHFPQLWLATDSPPPADIHRELSGIIAELYGWLHRYRRGIKLVERTGDDWPDVAQVFERRFWRGGVRRVADYLERRIRERVLAEVADSHAMAHLFVQTLSWAAVHRHWSSEGAELPDGPVVATAEQLLIAGLAR
jgi:AcrR family transcriptional regulator